MAQLPDSVRTASGSRPVAIELTEIITDIIDLLPRCDQAAAALKDVESLEFLLRLLAPTILSDSKPPTTIFSHSISEANWNRFEARAQLIKSLRWDDCGGAGVLDDRIFAQIFYHRPKALPMIGPALRTLWIRQSSANITQTILKGFSLRALQLTGFCIEFLCKMSLVDEALSLFLEQQNELRRAGLPRYYATKRIMAALIKLPQLQEVYETNWRYESNDALELMFKEGCLTNLRALSWTDNSLQRAAQRFEGYVPPRLVEISLTTYGDLSGDSGMTDFLSALAEAIPHLECIVLSHFTAGSAGAKTFEAL
ncbi:hypothetical protein FRB93_003877 [Tulasnella sp. JGI-2019a]|nr:hypothetical protein FRB93_003877 [Tulasnella sp. JGI-2019a]